MDSTGGLEQGEEMPRADEAQTYFKVDFFTRDIALASGTQEVTGVGFLPKAVILFATSEAVGEASWGLDDGANHFSLFDMHNTASNTFKRITSQSIRIWVSSTNYYDGYVSSWGSDGFTMTWTKNGSPTGTVMVGYLAFR